MPSQRKRIGFLPSEEVHEIIDKLCSANELSQSKVTGLLVEEALRFRGVLSNSPMFDSNLNYDFIKDFVEEEASSKGNISPGMSNYKVNKKLFTNDIKMMHEFIEFKCFKRVMEQNKDILE